MYLFSTLNYTLAIGSLLLLAATIVLFYNYFFLKNDRVTSLVTTLAWPIVIGVTTASVAMSLVYSEYFMFIPCSLCWLQRIALYPQALLSCIAFKFKDDRHFPMYGIALSIFGFLVAAYQYLYQMLPRDTGSGGTLPCLADGSNADCAVKVIDLFGFVTFPFIAAVTFAFLIAVYLHMLRRV